MSHKLRVLSYNIHKGFNQMNSRFLLNEIRHAIRQSNADLLFLQEVVGKNTRHQRKHKNWREASQFEFLADEVWPHYAYGKNAIYSHGHHGNAILTKYPFNHWQNHDISRWNFSQRGILHGQIINKIHVYCVHFGLFTSERNYQFDKMINIINRDTPTQSPLIIAGDFNDWHGRLDKRFQESLDVTDSHKALHGKLANTFPAIFPILPMDRIYTRGFEVLNSSVLNNDHWRGLSDHQGLFAELGLN